MMNLDVQCSICTNVLLDPVTTPCRHSFCKLCLLKALDHAKACPRCGLDLEFFNPFTAGVSAEIMNFLSNIPHLQNSQTWFLPIFKLPIIKQSTAFPSLCYTLLINNPWHIHMMREILFTGFAKFGMIGIGRKAQIYGTIMCVRDYLNFENGSCIITAIGTDRFCIRRYEKRHGYDVAHINFISDRARLSSRQTNSLIALGNKTYRKALTWINRMDLHRRRDIEDTLGSLPFKDENENQRWWQKQNGPTWFWWLVVVLPLRNKIRYKMLAKRSLTRRLNIILSALNTLLVERVRAEAVPNHE